MPRYSLEKKSQVQAQLHSFRASIGCLTLGRLLLCLTLFSCCLGGLAFPNQTSAQDEQPTPEALALFREAAGLQNAGEFDLAADVWDSFTEKFPNLELTQKAFHYAGVCHLQNGRLEKARDGFAAALARNKEGVTFAQQEDALLNLGWCQFQIAQTNGDDATEFENAAKTFTRLLKEFKSGKYADQAQFFLGESFYLRGMIKESVNPYAAVIEQHATSTLRPNAMYALGIAYEDLNQNREAAELYKRFLSDYANHELTLEIRMRSGELLMQQAAELVEAGEVDSGRQAFSQARATFADLASDSNFGQQDQALFQQAYCAFKLGNEEAAADLYVKLVSEFPDSKLAADATLSAGRSYYRSEKDELAKQWLRRSMARSGGESLEAAHWLCRILLREDQAKQALEVATEQLRTGLEGEFRSILRMDQADAVNAIPNRKAESIELYLEISNSESKSSLAAQALYYAAFAAFEIKDYDKAIELGKSFLDRFPSDQRLADVKAVLGEAYLQKEDFAAAASEFEAIMSTPDRKELPTWSLRAALAYYLERDFEKAITIATGQLDRLTMPSQLAEAHYLIGASQYQSKEWAAAKASLEKSLAADANWAQADETSIVLGRTEESLGNAQEAKQIYQSALADFTESSRRDELQFRLAEVYFKEENFAAAIDQYKKVIAVSESTYRPYALDGQAWASIKLQDPEAAIACLDMIRADHSEHPLAKTSDYTRGIAQNQTEQYAEAEQALNRYLQLDDLSTTQLNDANFELSLAAIGQAKFEIAIEKLIPLSQADSNFERREQAIYELAWCYLDTKQTVKANESFGELLAAYPKSDYSSECNFHLGEAAYADKRYPEAETRYKAAIANDEDSVIAEKAIYKLGWSHFHQDNFAEAETSFRTQLSKFESGPLSNDGRFMVAECQYRANRFDDAAASYEKLWRALQSGESFNPSYVASILLHGSQSAGQIKDFETAKTLGLKFVEDFKDAAEAPEAWLQVGRAARGLGEKTEAISALEKAALQSSNEIGAEARFIIGEIHFGDQEYDEAQKQFRRVMLGFGGENATRDVKLYQAMSAFEAARCSEVQIKDATGDERAKHIADARKFYNEVVIKHGESPYASQAQRRLASLPK